MGRCFELVKGPDWFARRMLPGRAATSTKGWQGKVIYPLHFPARLRRHIENEPRKNTEYTNDHERDTQYGGWNTRHEAGFEVGNQQWNTQENRNDHCKQTQKPEEAQRPLVFDEPRDQHHD